MSPEFLKDLSPVVLAGGRSKRFGRNKLLEPLSDGPLVMRPIRALREACGARVGLVGSWDGAVSALGDFVIDDLWPGRGPLGGIASALLSCGTDVLVLAGDLANITAEHVRMLARAAADNPGAWAVQAATDRPHPWGVYRRASLPVMLQRLNSGQDRLLGALPSEYVLAVELPRDSMFNVNRLSDLP